jgi:hypothetical protein
MMSNFDEMVEILIEDDLAHLMDGSNDARVAIATLLVNGFPGYHNYTETELVEELEMRGLDIPLA